MKVKELIEELQKFPGEMEVCIVDRSYALHPDDEEDVHQRGVYPDILITEEDADEDDAAFFKKRFGMELKHWVALSSVVADNPEDED